MAYVTSMDTEKSNVMIEHVKKWTSIFKRMMNNVMKSTPSRNCVQSALPGSALPRKTLTNKPEQTMDWLQQV